VNDPSRWIGREPQALREALRMSLRAFAEHLGAESVCAPPPPSMDEFQWKPALLGEVWLRFERDR
jgi:hypothetical protein